MTRGIECQPHKDTPTSTTHTQAGRRKHNIQTAGKVKTRCISHKTHMGHNTRRPGNHSLTQWSGRTGTHAHRWKWYTPSLLLFPSASPLTSGLNLSRTGPPQWMPSQPAGPHSPRAAEESPALFASFAISSSSPSPPLAAGGGKGTRNGAWNIGSVHKGEDQHTFNSAILFANNCASCSTSFRAPFAAERLACTLLACCRGRWNRANDQYAGTTT